MSKTITDAIHPFYWGTHTPIPYGTGSQTSAATLKPESPSSAILRGSTGEGSDVIASITSLWKGTETSLDSPPPVADSQGYREFSTSFHRGTQAAEGVGVATATHFQLYNHKTEVGHDHNFLSFYNVRGSAEDGTRFPVPWEIPRVQGSSFTPHNSNTILAIIHTP